MKGPEDRAGAPSAAMAEGPTEESGGGGKSTAKRREERAVESLGWLTESALMPRKRREIEGVGASSILELKAQLYRSQQEAKAADHTPAAGDLHPAKRRPDPKDPFLRKNSGVDSRNVRDKLELKAANDGSASYKALEKKAELYEKLSRGDIPDEEEKEKYCVDFFQKTLVHSTTVQPEDIVKVAEPPEANGAHDDSDPIFPTAMLGPGRTSSVIDKDEHKRFVREVHEEANQARERASSLKIRRQEQEAARREKLRQAYLKKQLEKLKAANMGQP